MARPLLKSMATVSGLTLVSRVLGFMRQMLLAGVIGASGQPVADAFLAAFRMPNMFRRLLAEGAFQAAFVPLFQGKSVKGDLAEAKAFAEDILAWLVVILTGLTAAVMLATPFFVSVLATGFRDDPERFELAVVYTRIMFPYLACMSVVGLYGGMLNALHRFAAAAAAPLLLNIALITGILLYADRPTPIAGEAAAWAVMAGGVLQVIALVIAGRASGLFLRLRMPRFNKSVRRLLTLGLPGFIGASALQVNLIVGTNVASRENGAVAWLFYADQLYQLPLALIGIALGVVLMPAISRSVKSGDERGAVRTLNRGLEIALFFALPAAIALVVIPELLAGALFQDLAGDAVRLIGAERSAFNDRDVEAVGKALMVFGCGLPAFVMQKVLAAAYFAREDTKSPMTFALVAIAINAVVSISLFPVIGFLSVALGTICASWTEVSLLAGRLGRRGHLHLTRRFAGRVARMALAALALGGALFFVDANGPALADLAFGQSWVLLLVVVALAVPAYAGIGVLLGAVDPKEWRAPEKVPAADIASDPTDA